MATTRQEIESWFDRGVSTGASYMLVMCDTYDWTDYPVFFVDADDAKRRIKRPNSMEKFMEAYDLKASKSDQLMFRRANCFAGDAP